MALERIGPYEFKGVLGRGGMGTVYRGRHEETGEIHAIKVLAPLYAGDPHFRGRFESEIKALLKLDHPNIVQILSYGQDDGMLFFSMELVEGNSLFQMQRRGHRFNWMEVISIAKDVALGLRHAHDRGVIHRDLKPGNLLMTADREPLGTVKITDFGIAKRFGTSQNTGTNVLGTMDFMSPEQAKGEQVTIRSDIYSLGTVLFTLLSGKSPFSSNSIEESLRNLTQVPAPRVSSVVAGVPKVMDNLIQKMMEKRQENRVHTTQALLFQIEEVELELKAESEAKTAHQSLPNESTGDTFLISSPLTEKHTGPDGAPSMADATAESNQTIDISDNELQLEPAAPVEVDYFKTVTEKTRSTSDSFELEPPPQKSGMIPVALAFVTVVLLAIYLIYRAFLPPSAEELYSDIESAFGKPHTVLEKMDLFLEHYPDDTRAEQVADLKKTGEAIRLYNTLGRLLQAQGNISGGDRLTPIEKQFLVIANLESADPATASKKMGAFITLYQKAPQLSLRDRKCVDAAVGYQVKIEHDARSKVNLDLRQIRGSLRSATKTTDPTESIKIYRSIIELYGKTNWGNVPESDDGRQLVRQVREKLRDLESTQSAID